MLSSSLLGSTCSGPVTDESVVINLDVVVVAAWCISSASIIIMKYADDSQLHTVTVRYICIMLDGNKRFLEWNEN